MISIFKKFLKNQEEEDSETLREKFDRELGILDEQVANEEEDRANSVGVSGMQNILNVQYKAAENDKDTLCTLRKGFITSLNGKRGVINNVLPFDESAVNDGIGELDIGCIVEYLSYREKDCDKVVKIQKIVEQFWDEESSEKKTDDQISELNDKTPICFNMQHRTILGLVQERREHSIIVDTEHKMMTVKLDDIEVDFVVRTGDRVNLICNVQLDESFVDQQGEILRVLKVEPARLQKAVKCTVERVFEDSAVLNDDAYAIFEDIPGGVKLHLGDIVRVDLIECERGGFIWRAIKLEKMDKTFGLLKKIGHAKSSKCTDDPAISFCGPDRCILVGLGAKKTITVKLTNNRGVNFKMARVDFDKHRDTQLQLVKPTNVAGLELVSRSDLNLEFEVTAKCYGESAEYYIARFANLSIKKVITVIVCQNDEEAQLAERRLITAMTIPVGSGRTDGQRSRHYANQVWSFKAEVVPGESIATKRRFVAVRIGYYEVPEKLRQTYLTSTRKVDMIERMQAICPYIGENLTFKNYVKRFQVLMHLEEMEYFVNFRNYDRERAHFLRDGEYLSLTIENLAERRPSIVIGDIVRAKNPWAIAQGSDIRCYEGIIHKVLFNRVLLKFNPSFQEKYNGEDYRLEFHFSRYGFRKQHHALNQIVKTLGEPFLFPTKVNTREHEQLEVRLDQNHDLHLYDSKLKWYNTQLNNVQKRAIYNILRNEVDNMPYIIFGPPGTGKTVTLVETILQLVRNLPSSRLLVGTPSNSSADLIAHRLLDSGALHQGEFVRLVSQNQIEKDLIPKQLQPYCATVDIGVEGSCADNMIVTESGLKLRCQMKYLGRHRITISTCATLGNFLQMGFSGNHFTHVLIDEAGQCTEPESIVPISMVSKKNGQVILAGDPHQLQAIVVNRFASDLGYDISLLERILTFSPYKKDIMRYKTTSGYDPRLMTKLLYNYRALPSIMNVYSELFYDSELVSMILEDSREAKLLAELQPLLESSASSRPITHGTHFHGVRCNNMQEEDSPSWYNPGEAKIVFIMTNKLYRAKVKPEQIGIVTPYTKQVKHLRDMFITAQIAMPKIGSVEEFQGQERDIILVSTVRSNEAQLESDTRYSLGFVRSNKRMNVAISRARCLMVIYGNPHLLSLDDYWRKLILYAYDNGAYSGCDLPKAVTYSKDGSDQSDDELVDEAVL